MRVNIRRPGIVFIGMKRTIKYIASVVVAGLVVWAFAARFMRQTSATPRVEEVRNEQSDIKINDLKGKYVLVNFWDSHNAVSRIATGEYDRFFRTHRNQGIELVSVNTDGDRGLFSELARKDGLDLTRQFSIADVADGNIPAGYKARKGYTSYLVNPSGKIVAYNPSVETLEKYLR